MAHKEEEARTHNHTAIKQLSAEEWGAARPSVIAIKAAAKHHGIPEWEIKGRCREQHVVAARWHAWNILHEFGWSYSKIGKTLGYDHTSIRHGIMNLKRKYPAEAGRAAMQLTVSTSRMATEIVTASMNDSRIAYDYLDTLTAQVTKKLLEKK